MQWLHYVGKGVYTLETFKHEALTKGVQRAVPFHQLKNFEFGTKILLAFHTKPCMADVFGYFTVSGVTHALPEKAAMLLQQKLRVVSEQTEAAGEAVHRACGNYVVACALVVDETMHSIVEKAKEACAEAGVNPAEYKWFLTGNFVEYPEVIRLYNQPFRRGYIHVDVPDTFVDYEEDKATEKDLQWILGYKRRRWLSKKRRAMFDPEQQQLVEY